LLEVDGIHLPERHELGDIDHLGGFALEGLQLLLVEPDVLVLLDLVALDQGRPVDGLLADRTVSLLADPAPALRVEEVEADGGRRGGGVEPDRDRDEPEGDRSRSDRMRWHRRALPARKSRRDEAFCTVSRGPLCFKAHGPAPTTWGRRPGEDHSLVINERPPRLPAPRRSPAPARRAGSFVP